MNIMAMGLLALALLASCATGAREGWTTGGEDPCYPASDYITAVGSGATQEAAFSNASRALAAVFGQDIQASVAQTSFEQVRDGGSSSQASLEAATFANVDVEDLAGVEIVDSVQEGGVWHALAAMDRRRASAIYSRRVAEARASVQAALLELEGAPPTLEAHRKAAGLRPVLDAMAADLAVLSIVDPKAAAGLSGPERALVDAAERRIRAGLVCVLSVQGDAAPAAEAALRGFLSSRGFAVADSDAPYRVEAGFSISHSEEGGFLFANWEFSIDVRNLASGVSELSWHGSGRRGGATAARADDMALRAALEDLGGVWPSPEA